MTGATGAARSLAPDPRAGPDVLPSPLEGEGRGAARGGRGTPPPATPASVPGGERRSPHPQPPSPKGRGGPIPDAELPNPPRDRGGSPALAPPSFPGKGAGGFGFFFAALALAALNFARQLPEVHSLDAVVFGDPGMALAVDAMLGEGRVPTEDFTYYYGLLGVAIDCGWYAAFGRTAAADTGLIFACNLLVAFGLVLAARALDFPPAARWLLLAGIPVAVMPLRYTTPTQALDAVLIVHALAFQARGKVRAAFAVAVAGVFVKSALASVYAAGLLGLILFAPRPAPLRQRLRDLIPGAAGGLVIGGMLAAWFGWGPLLKTLYPVAGMKTYAGGQFGFFFGGGRGFWLRESFDPAYYLFGPAGFWLLATAATLAAVPGLARARRDPRAVVTLTVAALHAVFVCFLFGNDQSWAYYSFLPVLGACAAVARWDAAGACPRWLRFGLPAVAVCGWVGFAVHGTVLWRGNVRTEATGGLFAPPDDAAAWGRVRGLAKAERVLVLTPSGAGRVLFPELDSVRSWALIPAVATPAEIADLLARLRTADVVVLHPVSSSLFGRWPPFAAELAAFEADPAATGAAGFRVLRRAGGR